MTLRALRSHLLKATEDHPPDQTANTDLDRKATVLKAALSSSSVLREQSIPGQATNDTVRSNVTFGIRYVPALRQPLLQMAMATSDHMESYSTPDTPNLNVRTNRELQGDATSPTLPIVPAVSSQPTGALCEVAVKDTHCELILGPYTVQEEPTRGDNGTTTLSVTEGPLALPSVPVKHFSERRAFGPEVAVSVIQKWFRCHHPLKPNLAPQDGAQVRRLTIK